MESLTAEVESLRDEVGSGESSIASTDASSSTTPPPFKPTITFGGSANLLYGGIDGDEDSAGRFCRARADGIAVSGGLAGWPDGGSGRRVVDRADALGAEFSQASGGPACENP